MFYTGFKTTWFFRFNKSNYEFFVVSYNGNIKLPEQASIKYGIKATPFTGQVSKGCALGPVV